MAKIDFKTSGTIAAGVVAAGTVSAMIQNRLFPVKSGEAPGFMQKPLGSAIIQIGLGALTPTLIKGAAGKNLATGMVVSGIATGVLSLLPGVSTSGLLRSTGSSYLPGVSGYGKADNAAMKAKDKVSVGMN